MQAISHLAFLRLLWWIYYGFPHHCAPTDMAADVAFRHLRIPSTRPDDCTADSCTLSLSIGWHDCMPFPGSHSVDRRIGAPHTGPLAAAAQEYREVGQCPPIGLRMILD